MTYFYSILIFILLVLIYMHFEAGWVQVKRICFTNSSKGLKILHISDIHISMLRVSSEKIRKIVKAEKPDLIIISGDYINKPVEASAFLEYLERIMCGHRTLLCPGNHDYNAFAGNTQAFSTFIKEIEALNARFLINSSVQIVKNKNKYNLIGLDDLREGQLDIERALKDCGKTDVNIAFTHNPDLALQLSGKIIDYLFCGHFHGGQIWMPFNLEFFLLRKDKLCKMGIKKGLHKLNGINLYINRGLGNVVVPLRFLSRPEVTIYIIP